MIKLLLMSLLFSLQSIKGKVMALLIIFKGWTNEKNNHSTGNLGVFVFYRTKASLDFFFQSQVKGFTFYDREK